MSPGDQPDRLDAGRVVTLHLTAEEYAACRAYADREGVSVEEAIPRVFREIVIERFGGGQHRENNVIPIKRP